MGFSLDDVGGLNAAKWNTFESANANTLNSYARVTAINSTSITIDTANAQIGAYEDFSVGDQILFHVSASVDGSTEYLGKWLWTTITAVSGDLLTINKNVTNILPADEFSKYRCQAITACCLRIFSSSETISPPAFSVATCTGGILVLKVKDVFHLLGHVNLTDKGIPATSKSLRPWLAQEQEGMLDTDKYAGWENGATADRFVLNSGDGAAFIVCGRVYAESTARIGNINSKGVLNCRGAADSANKPSGVTNIGGSTILIAQAQTMYAYNNELVTGATSALFSKYRSTASAEGQGLGRAYVALPRVNAYSTNESKYIDDQGCVAVDALDVPNAPANNFNIKNFGDGSLGSITNPTICINNYAAITEISSDRKQLTYTKKTTDGIAQIQSGALVMAVATSTSTDPATCRQEHGKMTLAKILSVTSTKITIDTALPPSADSTVWQIISVPQFQNFTLNTTYNLTPQYTAHGLGGVCALACAGTCNLSNGQLLVKQTDKAGWVNYGQKIPNANLTIKFPPTGGVGSVFVLANVLTMNSSTRIGSSFTGNKLGGLGNTNVQTTGGGWKAPDKDGYAGGNGTSATNTTTFDGKSYQNFASSFSPNMGANILILADTINNFHIAAISTGGVGYNNPNANGGCGYGGADIAGGGYHGGGGGTHGGGCAGNAFIFCNTANNQNTSGIVVDE